VARYDAAGLALDVLEDAVERAYSHAKRTKDIQAEDCLDVLRHLGHVLDLLNKPTLARRCAEMSEYSIGSGVDGNIQDIFRDVRTLVEKSLSSDSSTSHLSDEEWANRIYAEGVALVAMYPVEGRGGVLADDILRVQKYVARTAVRREKILKAEEED